MSDLQTLLKELEPLIAVVKDLKPDDPQTAATLNAKFPVGSPQMQKLKALVREGVEKRWLCDRENAGVRFSRVMKAGALPLSIDAVHMSGEGMGHTHPQGEIDLCFSVSGDPKFDGRGEGWTVYAGKSWHVPTVQGGVMDILYFLPGGAIQFGPQPEGTTAVGLQAK
jgi:hypothetical protein